MLIYRVDNKILCSDQSLVVIIYPRDNRPSDKTVIWFMEDKSTDYHFVVVCTDDSQIYVSDIFSIDKIYHYPITSNIMQEKYAKPVAPICIATYSDRHDYLLGIYYKDYVLGITCEGTALYTSLRWLNKSRILSYGSNGFNDPLTDDVPTNIVEKGIGFYFSNNGNLFDMYDNSISVNAIKAVDIEENLIMYLNHEHQLICYNRLTTTFREIIAVNVKDFYNDEDQLLVVLLDGRAILITYIILGSELPLILSNTDMCEEDIMLQSDSRHSRRINIGNN